MMRGKNVTDSAINIDATVDALDRPSSGPVLFREPEGF
jgi:hypothetical protein